MKIKQRKELLLKAIKAEENLKYRNDGVIGGFDNFILGSLAKLSLSDEKLQEYTDKFKEYADLKLPEKNLLLRKLKTEISEDTSKDNALFTNEEIILPVGKIKGSVKKEQLQIIHPEDKQKESQNRELTDIKITNKKFADRKTQNNKTEDKKIKQQKLDNTKNKSENKDTTQKTSQKKNQQANKKQQNNNTETSLENLPNIGPKRMQQLKTLGIEDLEDVVYYFPRRYEDRSQIKNISELVEGEVQTILATIKSLEVISPRPRLNILKVLVEDNTGAIKAIWYNQNFLKKKLLEDRKIYLTGKVDMRFEKQISVSAYNFADEGKRDNPGIVPIYSVIKGVSQKMIVDIIKNASKRYLATLEEYLPLEIIKEFDLISLKDAIQEMHSPSNWHQQNRARYRLVFDELLMLQLGVKTLRTVTKSIQGVAHVKDEELTLSFLKSLPYQLTKAQQRVIEDIKEDMESSHAMNRLIQGDVGSGKTVVAIWALLKAINGGYQGALMAPTEILAEQHYLSFLDTLVPLGIEPVLLTGSMTKKEKQEKIFAISQGEYKLIIGTHALIQKEVAFKNLALVVIDEQHRFGVNQRFELQQKGISPDLLVMTATPIPRSLALTLYGDMELSVIDELPPGRQRVKTYHLPEKEIDRVYNFIKKEVKLGGQVYIVCPLVEESEKLDLENATNLAEYLSTEVFAELNVGLIHGRLKIDEKEKVMEDFRSGVVGILVATTVIEVGVNIPNATVMMIQNAERFGLAQLHQLRGRVGRSSKQSYCILISDLTSKESKARMEIMTKSSDGFVIAEQDLNLRGPGDFFGTRQHGLPSLKIADIIRDHAIMETTKDLAIRILEEGIDSGKYNLLLQNIYKKFNKTPI